MSLLYFFEHSPFFFPSRFPSQLPPATSWKSHFKGHVFFFLLHEIDQDLFQNCVTKWSLARLSNGSASQGLFLIWNVRALFPFKLIRKLICYWSFFFLFLFFLQFRHHKPKEATNNTLSLRWQTIQFCFVETKCYIAKLFCFFIYTV